jgi:hypothetical protein
MIASTIANAALRKVGVSTNKNKKNVTRQERALRAAAPRYMTEAQAVALKVAGENGWTARSIVADAKKHACAVSIEKDGEIVWIASDGTLKTEEDIVKGSGAV